MSFVINCFNSLLFCTNPFNCSFTFSLWSSLFSLSRFLCFFNCCFRLCLCFRRCLSFFFYCRFILLFFNNFSITFICFRLSSFISILFWFTFCLFRFVFSSRVYIRKSFLLFLTFSVFLCLFLCYFFFCLFFDFTCSFTNCFLCTDSNSFTACSH